MPQFINFASTEQCDACRGEGAVMVSESSDQYGRTHASYDTRPGCGGVGEMEIEPPDDDCPEAIAQWATFGERDEGNWFTRLHDSDKAFAMRNGGQRDD